MCTSRAQQRVDHPTLIPGPRVRNAIASTLKELQPPTLQEGYQGITIIRSFEACAELVVLLSPPLTLFKFPRTAHLLDLGAATEDDIVQSSSLAFSASTCTPESQIVITEKIDGANLGISLDPSGQILIQNRAHWVNSKTHFQFKKLDVWVEKHREALTQILGIDSSFLGRYILFGEWMVCVHSIKYTRLPDRFLAFDLYDRSKKMFAARDALEARLEGTGIAIVPRMMTIKGRPEEGAGPVMPSDEELKAMVQWPSRFYDGRVEGVYIKFEKDGIVVGRGKVVRADFIAGNEHWTRGDLELNEFDHDQSYSA
jgi:atypical dual specificity phosphatase